MPVAWLFLELVYLMQCLLPVIIIGGYPGPVVLRRTY